MIAFDGKGNSSRSAAAVQVTTGGLAVPGRVAAVGGIDRVVVSWDAVSGSALRGYSVYRSDRLDGTYVLLMGAEGSDFTTGRTSYEDTAVVAAQVYFYRVASVDTSGFSSEQSVFVSAEVEADEVSPEAPLALSAIRHEADPGRVLLSWSPPRQDEGSRELSGLSGYIVLRAESGFGSPVPIDTLAASQTGYTDVGLQSLTTYSYTVIAFDGKGNSSRSAANVQVTTGGSTYSVTFRTNATSVVFPGYEATLQYGSPFGLISLRAVGQPGDFSHWHLPLADWEWFWYGEDGRVNEEKRIKLLDPLWAVPRIDESADSLSLLFDKHDVLLPGLNLYVRYTFRPDRRFTVLYGVINHTEGTVEKPYMMVGFPGFMNHKWVTAVATSLEPRYVTEPFGSFWEEAIADSTDDVTLLSDDGNHSLGRFEGIAMTSGLGRSFILHTTYVSTAVVDSVYSAHVNKAAYLTSHLYVLMRDLPPGSHAEVRVDYALSSTTGVRKP